MKESISEYARITIVMISFALMCGFILGGTWLNRLGGISNVLENEVVEDRQNAVLEELEERKPPELVVNGNTFKTGSVIKLTELIKKATMLKKDEDGKWVEIDIKNRVTMSCDSDDFFKDSNSLVPSNAGIYNVKFSVKDDYGLSKTVLVKIVVVDIS